MAPSTDIPSLYTKVYEGKSETPVTHFRCKTKLDGVGSVAECAHKAMSNQMTRRMLLSQLSGQI